MKDIQKIKEFFSQPMKEAKEKNKLYYKNIALLDKKGLAKKQFSDEDIQMAKKMLSQSQFKLDEAKKEIKYPKVKTIKPVNQYGWKPEYYVVGEYNNDNYILIPVDRFSEWEKTNLNKKPGFNKYEEIASKSEMENSLNEAKEEDKVDTITMDVPLFIRMLEYSREDAAEDMDLHDVTEKAISLGKERGILQMDDYDEIVGTTKEIKEGMGNEVGDKVYFKNEVGEKYPSFKGYYGIIEDTTPASNYNMMATYQVVVYDENDNEIRTIKTDFTNLTSKAVNEAVNLKQAKLSSAEYQKAKKLKDFKSSDWKWNASEDLYTKVIKEASSFAQQAAIAISKKKSGNYDKEGKRMKETSDPQSGKAAPYGSGYKPLEERIAKALDSINEELCPAGKAYRKRRMDAGEKSSAYLSGRAVKVCKGQISGKKKKK